MTDWAQGVVGGGGDAHTPRTNHTKEADLQQALL